MKVREKLVELLKEIVAIQECGFGDPRPTYETVASYLVSHGATVQEWIPVTDRLPNLDEAVLVFAEYLHIKTNYYAVWSLFKCQSGETIWVDKFGDGHNLTEVTYWIPLPSVPKGE